MSWNTTLKCVEEFNPGNGATLEKTYEVNNGKIKYDNGKTSSKSYKSLEDLNRSNTTKFVECKKRGRPRKLKGE